MRSLAVLPALILASAIPLAAQDSAGLRLRRPLQVTDSAVARGREVFHGVGSCSTCHGLEGVGTDSGAPLAQGVWLHGEDTFEGILSRVVHGIPRDVSTRGTTMPMRGWSTLSDQQVRDVAAYVWTISHAWMHPSHKR